MTGIELTRVAYEHLFSHLGESVATAITTTLENSGLCAEQEDRIADEMLTRLGKALSAATQQTCGDVDALVEAHSLLNDPMAFDAAIRQVSNAKKGGHE